MPPAQGLFPLSPLNAVQMSSIVAFSGSPIFSLISRILCSLISCLSAFTASRYSPIVESCVRPSSERRLFHSASPISSLVAFSERPSSCVMVVLFGGFSPVHCMRPLQYTLNAPFLFPIPLTASTAITSPKTSSAIDAIANPAVNILFFSKVHSTSLKPLVETGYNWWLKQTETRNKLKQNMEMIYKGQ